MKQHHHKHYIGTFHIRLVTQVIYVPNNPTVLTNNKLPNHFCLINVYFYEVRSSNVLYSRFKKSAKKIVSVSLAKTFFFCFV